MLTLRFLILYCLHSFVLCSFRTLGPDIFLDSELIVKLTEGFRRDQFPALVQLRSDGQLIMKSYSSKNVKKTSIMADDESVGDVMMTNDPDTHGYVLVETQPSRFKDLMTPSGTSPALSDTAVDVVVQFMAEPPTMHERERLFDLFASVSFPQRAFLQYINTRTNQLHPIHDSALIWRDDGDISMSRWTVFRTEDLSSTVSMTVNQLGELVAVSLLGTEVDTARKAKMSSAIAELCWIIADELSHELNVISKILRVVFQRLKLASHRNLQYCHLTTESIRIHGFQWTAPFNASVVAELKNSEEALLAADSGKYMTHFFAHQAEFRATTLAYLKTKDTDRFLATTSFPFLYRSKPLGLNDISINGISYGIQSPDPLACLTKYGLIPDVVAFHDLAHSTIDARIDVLRQSLGPSAPLGTLLLEYSKYINQSSFTTLHDFVKRASNIFSTESGPLSTRLWEYTKYLQNYYAQKGDIFPIPKIKIPTPPMWNVGYSDYWPRVRAFRNTFPSSEITTILEGLAKTIGSVGTLSGLYEELEDELDAYDTQVSNFRADAAKMRREVDEHLSTQSQG